MPQRSGNSVGMLEEIGRSKFLLGAHYRSTPGTHTDVHCLDLMRMALTIVRTQPPAVTAGITVAAVRRHRPDRGYPANSANT